MVIMSAAAASQDKYKITGSNNFIDQLIMYHSIQQRKLRPANIAHLQKNFR
jgi:hypothetical protein